MFYKGPASAKTTKLGNGTTATENRATRAVGYIRVSTDGQAQEGVSLDAQRAKLQAYALAMDIELVGMIEDQGRSASTLDRRGLKAALAMLTQGRADAVLITKLDRLTRSVKDLGSLVERYFVSGQYSLLSVSDSIDTRSPSGRLVLNVLGSVAQWEREAIVERTKEAMDEIKTQGYRLGLAPYGYRHSQRLDAHGRRIMEEDPAEQIGVRRVLELFDEGLSVKRIVVKLTAESIPKGRSRAWYDNKVYRILQREGRIPKNIRPRTLRQPAAALIREKDAVSTEVRKLRGEGLSLRQIAKRLSANGYGPPRGTRWHASTIASILDAEKAA